MIVLPLRAVNLRTHRLSDVTLPPPAPPYHHLPSTLISLRSQTLIPLTPHHACSHPVPGAADESDSGGEEYFDLFSEHGALPPTSKCLVLPTHQSIRPCACSSVAHPPISGPSTQLLVADHVLCITLRCLTRPSCPPAILTFLYLSTKVKMRTWWAPMATAPVGCRMLVVL